MTYLYFLSTRNPDSLQIIDLIYKQDKLNNFHNKID